MATLFKPKTPKPAEPVRMPTPEDTESRLAAERQRRAIAARGGRRATMLSRQRSTSGEAGTVSFGNTLLGQAG